MAQLLVAQQIVSEDNLLGAQFPASLQDLLDELIFLEGRAIADGPLGTGPGSKLLDGAVPVEEVGVELAVRDSCIKRF